MRRRHRVSRRGLITLIILVLFALALPVSGAAAEDGRIVFHSERDGNFEIYVMNANGTGQTRLTHDPSFDLGAAWSPDGSRIAFISLRDGNPEIYVMNADGSNPTRLTNNPAEDSDPAWSPDGTKIAFAALRDGNPEIYVMNTDGTGQARLTNNPAFDLRPAWSPDGSKITFHTGRDGNAEIYVMNADGTGQTNLTNNLAPDLFPDWSPDGSKIAFTSERDEGGNEEIYVMDKDGSNPTRLTNNPLVSAGGEGHDNTPDWSPDGSKIAFNSDRDGNFEIYVMNADGTGQTRLTTNPAFDTDPDSARSVDTVGLVDPATGEWRLRNHAGQITTFFYGNPGDTPFMGDWDCDEIDTPGLFRVFDAFAYLRNSNTEGIADIRFFFGNPSDIPLAGDFDGDGCDTLSLYRPSEQRFYIINTLGANEGGLGPAEFSFQFGNPGDKPFVGDFDGDGIDEVGLHRESTGFVYYRNTLDTGVADNEFFFGDPGDRFVAGDWGIVAGVDTPGLFRPGNATFYFRHSNTQGIADSQFTWGQSEWLPVAGNFALD